MWIACQEVEDQHRQAEAERAAEELKARKAAEAAAARKHAEVAKGKHPEITLPPHGEGSSTGQRQVVANAEVVGKEQGEPFPESE